MKPHYLIPVIAFLFSACIQKQNEFEDKSFFLSALTTQVTGTPKSFGVNIPINSRLARGCETRIGNLTSEAIAYKANATIGIHNGGNIRDEQGIKAIYPDGIIPKGTIPTIDLIRKFLPFTGVEEIFVMNRG
jgi:2',3'-cyclic-nucleotide 2'-phosphodiesterase (5'-nucleotidase family)